MKLFALILAIVEASNLDSAQKGRAQAQIDSSFRSPGHAQIDSSGRKNGVAQIDCEQVEPCMTESEWNAISHPQFAGEVTADADADDVDEVDSDFDGQVEEAVVEEEACVDNTEFADNFGDGCAEYAENTSWCGNYDSDVFFSMEMCCACMALDSDPLDIAAIVENWPAYDADTCEDNLDVKDLYNDTCSDYVDHTDWCFVYDHDNFDSGSDCCVCAALSGQELFDQLEYGANYEEDDYYDEETHGYDEWDDDW